MKRSGFTRRSAPIKRSKPKKRAGDDQKMLDACRGQRCWLLIPGVRCSDAETVVPAHRNEGKGMGLKVADVFTVPACHACHAEFDQGKRLLRDEKRQLWSDAYERWAKYRDGAD